MNTRYMSNLAGSAFIALAVSFAGAAVGQQDQENLPSSELQATNTTGTPEGIPQQEWMQATGTFRVDDQAAEVDVLIVEAENLVPEGVYTVWWEDEQAVLTPVVGLSTGPNDDLPENAFIADEQGNAQVRILAATDPPYQQIVIALHANVDEEVEDDEALAESVFPHLEGDWPRS